MAELRWVLLAAGIVILVVVFWLGRREARGQKFTPPEIFRRRSPALGTELGVADAAAEVGTGKAGGVAAEVFPPGKPQRIITVRLTAHEQAGFGGEALILAIREAGLRHGRFGIFHRHDPQDESRILFSVLSGKTAFCGTFACFASQRVCDQAVLAAYCRANVIIVGVEPGLASGSNRATHQTMVDIALMRAIPGMRVLEPADATETASMVEYLLEDPAPTYFRVPRGKAPVILEPTSYKFQSGKAVRLVDGYDITLVACRMMVSRTLAAADELKRLGIEPRVVNMSSIKPIDELEIHLAVKETGCIISSRPRA